MQLASIEVATYSGSNLLDSSSTFIAKYYPVTVETSTATFAPATGVVSSYEVLAVKFTITNPVSSGGKLFIYFPKWEDSSLGAPIPGTMLGSVSSCSSASDIAGSSPTCTPTIQGSTEKDFLTVTNAIESDLASGDTIEILITSVRNPPTMKPYVRFEN